MEKIQPETIYTRRLVLEPLQVEHAEVMATVLLDRRLHEFIGGEPATVEQLRADYQRRLEGPDETGVSWCNWVGRERESQRLIGTGEATIRQTAEGLVAEIAAIVAVPWQGQGMASEGAEALVIWLRKRGIRRIIAHVNPEHHASSSVASSTGLVPTPVVIDGETQWRLDLEDHT